MRLKACSCAAAAAERTAELEREATRLWEAGLQAAGVVAELETQVRSE